MADDSNLPAEIKRERLPVFSPAAIMDTARFEHLGRVATVMAEAGLMPETLTHEGPKGKREMLSSNVIKARAFLIAAIADRWQMDPLAVMNCCSLVHNKLMYEGKLVAAVIEARLGVRLDYEFGVWDPKTKRVQIGVDATGEDLGVVVSATLPGETKPRSVEGFVGGWRTTGDGSPWGSPHNWKRQLRYRGAREFANAYASSLMLGVLTEDDIDEIEVRALGAPTPKLDDAFGKPKSSRRAESDKATTKADTTGKSYVAQGEASAPTAETVIDQQTGEVKESAARPTETAGAGAVESEPATSASAIDASTGSAAETSGPSQPEGQSSDGAEENDGADAVLDNATVDEFNAFAERVKASKGLKELLGQFSDFRRTPTFQKAPEDAQMATMRMVWDRISAANIPDLQSSVSANPVLYELWLYQAPAHAIDDVWSALVRSKAYDALPDSEKERLADLTEAQQS